VSAAGFPDRAEIEGAQLAALRNLFAALIPNNRFYSRRFAEAGFLEGIASLADFAARMPFTTKQELAGDQHEFPPYGTNLTYPLGDYTRFSQTSGSSGSPLRWLDTTESWGWMVGNWMEVLRACGVRAEDRILFAFSFGPYLGFWTAFEAGVRHGCLCLPGGGMSSLARLQVILDNGVTVLCCTPTYALRLGEVAQDEGICLADSKVRIILVAGEPGAGIPATRARIEGLWPGARLWDHHGMTEVGPVTFECPIRTGVLHVIESSFIPEVIDPESGRAVGPGERGELVLTNLGRTGSPLLRYRTGDLVSRAAAGRCECGRYDMALEGGILGRADDMVIIRGVNVYATAVEQIVRSFDQVAEYRVELSTDQALPEIALLIETVPDCADAKAVAQEIEAAMRTAFNLRVPVAIAPPGSLPRFELKAKRWVRQ
jgi:phenylacetate-CoA ligase